MTANQTARPASRTRDPRIDAVRGIALMGILVVNLPFLAMPYGFAGASWHHADTFYLGSFSAWFIQALFENKFILIFAFLFGMGAAAQVSANGARRFVFRMLLLGLLGVLNAVLVFEADILLPYAVLGLLMLPLHRLRTRTLLSAALLFWIVAILGHALFAIYVATAETGPGLSEEARIQLFSSGGFVAMAHQRALDWLVFSQMSIPAIWPMTMSAFCLGMAAFRLRIASAGDGFSALERIARVLLLPALLGNLAYGALCLAPADWAGGHVFLATLVLRPVFAPMLSFVIFALLFRLLERTPRLTDFFAASGRMSLSIYMFQGILGGFIFFGYGAGLYASLSLQAVLALAFLLFVLLALLARLWLGRFRSGPFEALMAAALTLTERRLSTPPAGLRAGPRAAPR